MSQEMALLLQSVITSTIDWAIVYKLSEIYTNYHEPGHCLSQTQSSIKNMNMIKEIFEF